MPDALNAALDAIRERSAKLAAWVAEADPEHASMFSAADLDLPRLLALADAVLKLAADWKQEAARLDEKADRAQDSASSSLLSVRAQGCDDHSRALTGAITRELLGEDSTDG